MYKEKELTQFRRLLVEATGLGWSPSSRNEPGDEATSSSILFKSAASNFTSSAVQVLNLRACAVGTQMICCFKSNFPGLLGEHELSYSGRGVVTGPRLCT